MRVQFPCGLHVQQDTRRWHQFKYLCVPKGLLYSQESNILAVTPALLQAAADDKRRMIAILILSAEAFFGLVRAMAPD